LLERNQTGALNSMGPARLWLSIAVSALAGVFGGAASAAVVLWHFSLGPKLSVPSLAVNKSQSLTETVTAKRFVLVDERGKPLAVLGSWKTTFGGRKVGLLFARSDEREKIVTPTWPRDTDVAAGFMADGKLFMYRFETDRENSSLGLTEKPTASVTVESSMAGPQIELARLDGPVIDMNVSHDNDPSLSFASLSLNAYRKARCKRPDEQALSILENKLREDPTKQTRTGWLGGWAFEYPDGYCVDPVFDSKGKVSAFEPYNADPAESSLSTSLRNSLHLSANGGPLAELSPSFIDVIGSETGLFLAPTAISLKDKTGTRAVFGQAQLETVRIGATEDTGPSSLTLFDKKGRVLWHAP
jgi:hypothetical protein